MYRQDKDISDYAQRIASNLEINLNVASDSIDKFRPLFHTDDHKEALENANQLCDWILSQKECRNCWGFYSVFKWHLCEDWINSKIYQEITSFAAAAEKFELNEIIYIEEEF